MKMTKVQFKEGLSKSYRHPLEDYSYDPSIGKFKRDYPSSITPTIPELTLIELREIRNMAEDRYHGCVKSIPLYNPAADPHEQKTVDRLIETRDFYLGLRDKLQAIISAKDVARIYGTQS